MAASASPGTSLGKCLPATAVSAVMNQAQIMPVSNYAGGVQACSYQLAVNAPFDSGENVALHPGETAAEFAASNGGGKPVSGAGGPAFLNGPGDLWVFHAPYEMEVQSLTATTAQLAAIAKAFIAAGDA
jgi:hypothetical protein